MAVPTAALTFWDPGILVGPAAMNGSARGTALVVLVLGVPLLAVTGLGPRSGRLPWLAARTGALAFLTYNAVLFAFATPFNRLFLLYVALLGLAVWTFTSNLVELLRRPVSPGRWSRPLAVWLGIVTLGNALLWLASIVPTVSAEQPQRAIDGLGVATNPVWVQDLAVWLPAAAVVAVALWRGRGWSTPAAASLTTYWVLEAVSVAVDQWFGSRADPGSTVVSAAVVPGFLLLAAVGCVPAVTLLRTTSERRA